MIHDSVTWLNLLFQLSVNQDYRSFNFTDEKAENISTLYYYDHSKKIKFTFFLFELNTLKLISSHSDISRCASECMCYEGDNIVSFMYDKALCSRIQRE